MRSFPPPFLLLVFSLDGKQTTGRDCFSIGNDLVQKSERNSQVLATEKGGHLVMYPDDDLPFVGDEPAAMDDHQSPG